MTRSSIDWLGFKKDYVFFEPNNRNAGKPSYSNFNLIKLAITSLVSMTLLPLYIFGYIGVFFSSVSLFTGIAILVEQVVLSDPLGWKFTGPAMLAILIIFLIGIVLMALGVVSLYIANIHTEIKKRPIYIVDEKRSIGIKKK